MKVRIFANGLMPSYELLSAFRDNADLIIAADGGANHCAALLITPDILIGDLDSIHPEVLDQLKQNGTVIKQYPEKKDATDLELALDEALRLGGEVVQIIAAVGGRWDMSLSNIHLCARKKYADLTISLLGDDCILDILRPGSTHILDIAKGRRVSLLALREQATGITLQGFEYPMKEGTLTFGSSQGISNLILERTASITHQKGVLLCIQSLAEG